MVSSKSFRWILFLLFAVYMGLLIYLVLFSQEFGRVALSRDVNLVPFDTIRRYIVYRERFSDLSFYTNIYGNILAFMPFGFFIFVFEKKHNILKGMLMPMFLSVAIEISQYIMSVGSLDVDDIILNTIGGFLIYVMMYSFYMIRLQVDKLT